MKISTQEPPHSNLLNNFSLIIAKKGMGKTTLLINQMISNDIIYINI